MKHNNSPCSVLYIITKLELGGAQKVCLSLLHDLQKHNTQTYLLSGTDGPLVDQVKNLPNVTLLSSFTREIHPLKLWQELKNFFAILRHIRSLKHKHPDLIVHTHSTKAGLIGRWAALFAGVKKRIHTVHGYGFHEHQHSIVWLACYIPELLTSFITTHFVCVSHKDRQTGSKLFPHFAKKSSIIRAAVDWDQFYIPARKAPEFPQQQPFIFGTVSCFKPQKNLFDLLQAFKKVHEQNNNTRLELVGDGQLRLAIETWIHEHNLTKVVHLHGWQERVAPIMLNWNAFVLSSLWEGLPCALIEARLLKLPIIAYNTGGIKDVISHGANGYIVDQKDWHTLADYMLTLSEQKDIYTNLQKPHADLHAFKPSVMAEQHYNVYKSL